MCLEGELQKRINKFIESVVKDTPTAKKAIREVLCNIVDEMAKEFPETIHLDDKKLILKKYRLRTAGNKGATIEITVPKAVVEREAV